MDEITLADELSCARRELRLRRQLYPDFVARHKMTQAQADFQLACQERIVRRLEALVEAETRQGNLFVVREEGILWRLRRDREVGTL